MRIIAKVKRNVQKERDKIKKKRKNNTNTQK